ncbi:unnamed protein product [Peniophora sp. CBMAI 1063]|nr:unnamed protein product [Peniophora sp. CBMAI 1063]
MSSPVVDVLVVGAGPVGLVGALALVQSGVSVRIIDKATNFEIGQRGSGIMPRSQEAFLFLGILDDYLKAAYQGAHIMRLYDPNGQVVAETPMRVDAESTPEIPIPQAITLGQDSNCRILRKHLAALGVNVETGTELLDYEQDDDGVTATVGVGGQDERIRTQFLLGADGAKGPTRRIGGIHFEGKTDEITAIIGDIEIETALDRSCWHRFTDEKKNGFVARPVPENDKLWFIVIGGQTIDTQRLLTDVSYLSETMCKISRRTDIDVTKVRTLAEWRLNERVADRFMVGHRVIIAGDAAHCHSPTGGQGINNGVLDVMNIFWKLVLVIKGLSPLSLLSSYEEERMPVIREMLRLTTKIADKTFKNTNDNSAWERPLALRQLGVHYRWSSVVVDELREGELVLKSTNIEPEDVYGLGKPDRLHAGDRAPDAPELVSVQTGAKMQLFRLFKPTQHTIIVLDPALAKDVHTPISAYPEGAIQVVVISARNSQEQYAELNAFVDSQGHAHRAYRVDLGVKVAIIRPDGVVGALLRGPGSIEQYFAKLFT